MSVLIYSPTKNTGPIIIVTLTAHQTPTLASCNGPPYFLPTNVIHRVLIPSEIKLSGSTKQNCGVYFSIMHHREVPVHKIPSCFIVCVISSWTTVILYGYKCSNFVALHPDDEDKPTFRARWTNNFHGNVFSLAAILSLPVFCYRTQSQMFENDWTWSVSVFQSGGHTGIWLTDIWYG